MEDTEPVLRRWIVSSALVATALVFWLPARDPLHLFKLTVAVAAAVALTTLASMQAVRRRRFSVPVGWPIATVAIYAVLLVISTATSEVPATSIMGQDRRHSGLLLYGACLVLFLAALLMDDGPSYDVLTGALIAAGAFIGLYGLAQAAGLDPVSWLKIYGSVIATLGNPNFVAGWLAILAPVSAAVALGPGSTRRRGIAGGALALALVVGLLTRSVQGPVAAASGLAVVAIGWLLGRPPQAQRLGLRLLSAGAALAIVLGIVSALGVGPLASELEQSTKSRRWYWTAAASMTADHPIAGVGLDMYGSYYRAHRPLEATRTLGVDTVADAPHNVPLGMFASGGVPLGLAYLAVIGATGVCLVIGLRRLHGADRLALAGLGGGWLAYQVQSLVSIDQPPLAVLHWVLAGMIIGRVGVIRRRELRLPGATAAVEREKRESAAARRAGGRGRTSPASRSGIDPWVAVVAVLGVGAMVLCLLPLRADVLAGSPTRALDAATDLAPWDGTYWFDRGLAHERRNEPKSARAAYDEAVRRNPRHRDYALRAAQVYRQVGDTAKAERFYNRVVELDPTGAEVLVEVAEFRVERKQPDRAVPLLREALRVRPEMAPWWKLLGDAQASISANDEAASAYRRALELDPTLEAARVALAALNE